MRLARFVFVLAASTVACASLVGIEEVHIVDADAGDAAREPPPSTPEAGTPDVGRPPPPDCATPRTEVTCPVTTAEGPSDVGDICGRCFCKPGLKCLAEDPEEGSGVCSRAFECGRTCTVNEDCASLECLASVCR